jgi:peptide deformylase
MSQVVKYPDPILSMVAPPGVPGTQMEVLFERMEAVMKEEGGIGLAAPQIGVSVRAVVVKDRDKVHRMLNPRITSRSGITNPTDERCLSVPGFERRRQRSYSVVVQGTDALGLPLIIRPKGMDAAVWQHELDHLDGRTIVDA